MRKWLVGFGALFLLLLAALLCVRSGLRGPVPTVDPIVRWNAEHADLADNAADLYRAAFARLSGEADPNWPTDPNDPVPADAAVWVEQNREALDLARQATQRRQCWFAPELNADGDWRWPHLSQMRVLAKLLLWQALIAVHQHDAMTLADSAITIDRIARHVDAGAPILINALVGIAIHSLAHGLVTQPMLWPEVSAAERTAYIATVTPIFDPPPPLTDALAGDQEDLIWSYLTSTPASLERTFFAAPDRLAGELERYLRPLQELAAVPIERQSDPCDPLVVQVQALENEEAPRLNIPRTTASILLPSAHRALAIRIRVITEQRGTRTVLELFAYRDRTGAFPDSLDAVDGDYKIDPFSGRPFVYRRTEDGFTLYSVGTNRKDDGGQHDPRFGEEKPDRDFVFWPIPNREPTSPDSQP